MRNLDKNGLLLELFALREIFLPVSFVLSHKLHSVYFLNYIIFSLYFFTSGVNIKRAHNEILN